MAMPHTPQKNEQHRRHDDRNRAALPGGHGFTVGAGRIITFMNPVRMCHGNPLPSGK
jgi:hypothetical protein